MDPRRHMANGFLWLGSSSLVSGVVDTLGSLAILWFVTREEMGMATLAWSVAVFLEAFNGLGVGPALVQAPDLSRRQLSTLFWYVAGLAAMLVAIISASSPLIASIYGQPNLAPMIVVASAKLLLVGAALVPLQLLNRALKFRQVATITATATLLSAVLKVVLAVAGFGAWALVLGHASHGAFVLIGVNLISPFRPALIFAFSEVKRLVVFGIKVATSGVLYHFYRNADFLLVGRFLGVEALGVYRVAFDLAMSFSMALLNIVNRAAFPVYARVAHDSKKLVEAFLFTARSLSVPITGVLVVVGASADHLLLLLGKGQWVAAAPAVQVLCVAAWLRCLAHTFPQLFYAAGRPALAVYDSLVALVVLSSAFALSLSLWGNRLGVLSVSYAWLACYPLLLTVLWVLARTVAPLRLGTYLRALAPAVGVAAVLLCGFAVLRQLEGLLRPGGVAFSVHVALGVVLFAAYLRVILGVTPRALLAQARQRGG
jgi:O-antigen/teichoic acid export membrane protein